ncbi:hypothetical protein BI147_22285 [Achromobacter xylosoxidans]|nr:hypothetical protein C2U31_01245 [Achromobacter sp. AONIH1]OMG88054.1 hypothetical protein BI147_22285 [Achromobacter xylosoxidans]
MFAIFLVFRLCLLDEIITIPIKPFRYRGSIRVNSSAFILTDFNNMTLQEPCKIIGISKKTFNAVFHNFGFKFLCQSTRVHNMVVGIFTVIALDLISGDLDGRGSISIELFHGIFNFIFRVTRSINDFSQRVSFAIEESKVLFTISKCNTVMHLFLDVVKFLFFCLCSFELCRLLLKFFQLGIVLIRQNFLSIVNESHLYS